MRSLTTPDSIIALFSQFMLYQIGQLSINLNLVWGLSYHFILVLMFFNTVLKIFYICKDDAEDKFKFLWLFDYFRKLSFYFILILYVDQVCSKIIQIVFTMLLLKSIIIAITLKKDFSKYKDIFLLIKILQAFVAETALVVFALFIAYIELNNIIDYKTIKAILFIYFIILSMTLFIPLAKMFSVIIQERNQKKASGLFLIVLCQMGIIIPGVLLTFAILSKLQGDSSYNQQVFRSLYITLTYYIIQYLLILYFFENSYSYLKQGQILQDNQKVKKKENVNQIIEIIPENRIFLEKFNANQFKIIKSQNTLITENELVLLSKTPAISPFIQENFETIGFPYTTTDRFKLHTENDKSSRVSKGTQRENCLICFDNLQNSVLYPCLHGSFCLECSKFMYQIQKTCCFCRKEIEIIGVYKDQDKQYEIMFFYKFK